MWDDKNAMQEFEEIAKNDFEIIIETGTWKGDGTLYFTQFRDLVYTIEVDPHYYVEASQKFMANGYKLTNRQRSKDMELRTFQKDKKIIHSLFAHSPEGLRSFLNQLKDKKILFFLDAHWDKAQCQAINFFPVNEELKVLAEFKQKNCYIVIHDIKHPEKDFGYDSINTGLEEIHLTLDYIKPFLDKINKDFKLEFNKESETKRGILYVKP